MAAVLPVPLFYGMWLERCCMTTCSMPSTRTARTYDPPVQIVKACNVGGALVVDQRRPRVQRPAPQPPLAPWARGRHEAVGVDALPGQEGSQLGRGDVGPY